MSKADGVLVRFPNGYKNYAYRLPYTLENKVQVHDYLVVPTSYGDTPYSVVTVSEILYDFAKSKYAKMNCKYVVGKVDDTEYLERQQAEEKSAEFDRVMKQINNYCRKYNVELMTEIMPVKNTIELYPEENIVITLSDSNKYKPNYYYDPKKWHGYTIIGG